MLGSPAGPGAPSQRGVWTSASIPSATGFTSDGFGKYGVYSLFPGGPTFGSALYSHANTFGRFTSTGHLQPAAAGSIFHGSHKDSLFSSTGYTFGAPTPPPGSPYSPIPVAQLELLSKGLNSNIIIQSTDYNAIATKKAQITEPLRCDEKCCRKACDCRADVDSRGKMECLRLNEWSGVNVKKEPGGHPCQVAEISTSISPVIKVEIASPTQKAQIKDADSLHGNIPVGIAVARQRFQQPDLINSPSLPPAGLLTTVNAGQLKEMTKLTEIDSSQAGMAAATAVGGATASALLQCTDDRTTALASWPMGAAQTPSLTTPTLWQYPAPVPMESMVPLPVPMPPVGFQLVRDPTTGGLILLPTTTSLEPVQQTVFWPGYPQQSSLLIPPMPPPPLQLLSTTSDYLSSSATLQHTQTHSTRLVAVTTDNKRKMPLPATTLIKIETDALDQTKTISTMANSNGGIFSDQNLTPLVTTHVIYQHPTNLILSQTPAVESTCKSQATSPVTCLTPPPEVASTESQVPPVQDASNQTDSITSEDDNTTQTVSDIIAEPLKTMEETKVVTLNDTKVVTVEVNECVTSKENISIESSEINSTEVCETVKEIPEKTTDILPESIDSTIKEKSTLDLTGLELLSNSIVEFETCRNKTEVSNDETKDCKEVIDALVIKDELSSIKKDDSLGGLDLLCALAEQRILEESEEPRVVKEKKSSKKEKRKSRRHSDEPRHKKRKSDKYYSDEDRYKIGVGEQKLASEETNGDIKCMCHVDYKSYKTPQSEEEVKRFIASKSQSICCKGDWPCMNQMELDMRMRLADLQRQYREKQKELSKLKVKKHHPCCRKKSRKKSSHSDKSDTPPLFSYSEEFPTNNNSLSKSLNSPTFTSSTPQCYHNETKENEYIHKIQRRRHSVENTISVAKEGNVKRKYSTEYREKTPEHKSASKKRKVGRPKKLSELYIPTETIVAKKSKTGFVSYLMAAKEKYLEQNVFSDSPPRYTEEYITTTKNKNNNDVISKTTSKIRPKLKAEATIKTYNDEDREWETEEEIDVEDASVLSEHTLESDMEEEPMPETEIIETKTEEKSPPHVCVLTEDHLNRDKLRVLTVMGGLFYAGLLNAVEPPDVYSITLDGERGNRPHIMSREEILRDAIVEVAPKSPDELKVGTRLCAYWSQQYRCLYPGSVAEPGTPNSELDDKFVSVEFDDGDSGTIAIEDIRLLPSDYPIMEYDPNPLLSLCKRKRRASTSASVEEKKPKLPEELPVLTPPPEEPMEKKLLTAQQRERKKLKKKKKQKLKEKLMHDEKKKKKKHRCNDENCKHKKKHKKHRKHKRHHHEKVNIIESVSIDEKIEETNSVTEEWENKVEVLEPEPEKILNEEIPDAPINPDDEVTMDDILEAQPKTKKIRDRQESCESSRSKMSAFLPARQLWGWSGKGYKRHKGKGRLKKEFFRSIQRGKELITVGDSAVFLSTGRPDRPYIGKIEAMWEQCGTMVVKVKWFYHPEETAGCPLNLKYPGALFESPHIDENDVQTISHKCEVLPLAKYVDTLGNDPQRFATIYDNNDIYYLAGYYDPTTLTLKFEGNIPLTNSEMATQQTV